MFLSHLSPAQLPPWPPPPHRIRVEEETPLCGVDLRSGGDGEALQLTAVGGLVSDGLGSVATALTT